MSDVFISIFGKDYYESFKKRRDLGTNNKQDYLSKINKTLQESRKKLKEMTRKRKEMGDQTLDNSEVAKINAAIEILNQKLIEAKEIEINSTDQTIIKEQEKIINRLKAQLDEANSKLAENNRANDRIKQTEDEYNDLIQKVADLQRLYDAIDSGKQGEAALLAGDIAEKHKDKDVEQLFKDVYLPAIQKKKEEDDSEIEKSLKKEKGETLGARAFNAIQT